MAALQDGMVFRTRKGIFKTFTFWAHFGTELLRINYNKDRKCRVGLYDYDLPLLFIE